MASEANRLIVVFLGAPGAGKGTQAAAVAPELGLTHISSGDMFRRAAERSDEFGRSIRAYMEKGSLVPDKVTTRMVLDELKGGGRGIILDGFPRNVNQAVSLDQALQKKNRAVGRVIHIKVPDDELLRRLSNRWLCRQCQAPYSQSSNEMLVICKKCAGELYQRPDDQPDTVKKRLAVYLKETTPLIDYYRKQHKLFEIDGNREAIDITRCIVAALGETA